MIVTVYQSVLSDATIDALGIDLEGRTLVFDEAHNLMDSITQINSVDLQYDKVVQAHKSIKEYHDKYKSRMLPKNIKMIFDLLTILESFKGFFDKDSGNNLVSDRTVDVIDVLSDTDLYSYDFSKILEFFEKADLVKKLNGFIS